MYSLQSNGTIPHPLEPAYLRGLGRRRCALPSPPSNLGLETCLATLHMCSAKLAAEGWSCSTEELRRCGHCVEEWGVCRWVTRWDEIRGGTVVECLFFDEK
jgi:hypothetical protein